VSGPERAHFQVLLDLDLQNRFRLNLGMCIDHILLSAPLAQRCTAYCWRKRG